MERTGVLMAAIAKPMNVQFGPDIHSEITQTVNTEFNNMLDDQQLGMVILANMTQDIHQTESKIHFDNCAFAAGVEYINSEWETIRQVEHFSPVALGAFGRLLHTVQDFYSHSNWIELYTDYSPIPIWDLDVNNLPRGIFSGTWFLGSPKMCAQGTPSHDELNKDSPTSKEGKKIVEQGPNMGKSLYELAYSSAIAATAVQFELFKNSPDKPLLEAMRTELADLIFSFEA